MCVICKLNTTLNFESVGLKSKTAIEKNYIILH